MGFNSGFKGLIRNGSNQEEYLLLFQLALPLTMCAGLPVQVQLHS